MAEPQLNAHVLFDKFKPKSESWWTALFTMSTALLAKAEPSFAFKLYRYRRTESEYRLEESGETFPVERISFENTYVEAALQDVFPELNPRTAARPDVAFVDRRRKTVSLIEVKTLQRGGEPANISKYVEWAKRVQEELGFSASTILLISQGHPDDIIWEETIKLEIPVLRWEDVLRAIDGIEWLRELFKCDLRLYYGVPLMHGQFDRNFPLPT
jgi:hypothetical protein